MARSRKLHIGGQVRTNGWEVLDANPGPVVDHLGDARDLKQFEDGAFDALYASHVLEHFDYKDELPATLREWRRVLAPRGTLFVSVPDMRVLASLFVAKDELTVQERYDVMRMIFGGHVDRYDYHQIGFDIDILTIFLTEAGFQSPRRVPTFGLFADTSGMAFKGVPISLNMICQK